ncbi:glycerol transporter [Blastocladiella emersonii ATCC 22665]|nr:glycerol transporter [Blastocladiella emersonii ATCC 22665]
MNWEAPPPASRWNTAEYYVYYVVAFSLWGYMYWTGYTLSQPSHPNAYRIDRYLSDAWLPFINPLMDNSDHQYAGFRKNLPILFAAMLGYLALSWTVKKRASAAADASRWLAFSIAFSTVFLVIAHGQHVVKVLAILAINYALGRIGGGTWFNPALTWAFNIAILFAIDWTRGFRALDVSGVYAGIMRWDITFNITVLRLISFNLDYYWSHHELTAALLETHKRCASLPALDPPPACCTKMRSAVPRPAREYSFTHYLAYALYIPLYFAGPIMPFNAWMSQVTSPPRAVTRAAVTKYAARLAGAVLLMEVMMHLFHVVALARAREWAGMSPLEIGAVGFINLKFIWLKLLIIWRFFRTWALADGIDPPENMRRCVTNHYSAIQFWRDWHTSFNAWNIRYLYVPLGGARTRALNIWVVFTFVAVWHDIELRLLAWGWLICLFILPEVVARLVFAKYTTRPWYRHLAALGAVLNILTMITANLVGFAVGVDGMRTMLASILQPEGLGFLAGAAVCLYASAHIFFEVRDQEARDRAALVERYAAVIPHHDAVEEGTTSGVERAAAVRGRIGVPEARVSVDHVAL